MRTQNWKKLNSEIDQLLKEGRFTEAQELLTKMRLSTIPRGQICYMAGLMRRAHLPNLALRLLNPIVRPTKAILQPAEPHEIAEYAAALQKMGCIDEALSLIDTIDSNRFPQADLYRAYCCFSRWDYQKSIPYLQQYTINPHLTEYQRLIGGLNLAAAYVACFEKEKAMLIIDDLITAAKNQTYRLLRANALELKAQLFIFEKNYAEAQVILRKAQNDLTTSQSLDSLFIEKWDAILKAVGEKDTTPIHQFKQRALAFSHWETLRDLDLFINSISHNTKQITYLYFGSPHEGYRTRIKKLLGNIEMPDIAYLQKNCLSTYSDRPRDTLDPLFREGNFNFEKLKTGQALHRTLVLLLTDFYRPFSVGDLFSKIFQGEHYNLVVSANRVHQVISRLKSWFTDENIPITIDQNDGMYSLKILSENLAIKLYRDYQKQTVVDLTFEIFKQKIKGEPFKLNELAKMMDWSKSNAHRILKVWQDKGLIDHDQRQTTDTKYMFHDSR